MQKLSISLALDLYDHVQPLLDGSITADGLDLDIVTVWGGDRHDQMIAGKFDVAEFSLASYFVAFGKDESLSAIPVFPRRMFGHRYIYVNANSGIASPQDLRGKKIGIKRYSNTLAFWFKGWLQHSYGIELQAVHWFLWQPEVVDLDLPPGLSVTHIKKGADLAKMLEEGELDAVIFPESTEIMGVWRSSSPHVKRLFSDVRTVEREYFQTTGDFPIMHLIVGRKDLLEAEPWIARSLYEAFERAKQTWFKKMESPTFVSLAWSMIELEEDRKLFGEARWPYGIEANRKSLELMTQYAVEQGLISAPVPVEKLFCFHE